MEQKHGPPLDNSRGIWMRLTSSVCGVHYAFPGGSAFLMKRSADVLYQPPLTHIIRTSTSIALRSSVTHSLWTCRSICGPQ